MTILNAGMQLRLILPNANNYKPQTLTDPNTPIRSDYTINDTCRLLLANQIAQTHCITLYKLRFIIV